jgi:uncharacterized protein involved in oxidation of intracellular sulfur
VKTLFILNDPPYGTERSYNGARLAHALAKRDGEHVRLFLISDAVSCAKRGQKTPNGYYNLETTLQAVARCGSELGVCGTCIDARGIGEAELLEGAHRSNMDELAAWTAEADRVLVF